MKNLLKIFFLNLVFTTSLLAQDEEFGLASYYSDLFHGKPTASGEAYDKNKYTCAHKTHPFGTMLKITRLDNNKTVQVRVTDRGPFISGRVVEISRASAEAIGLIQDGSARVKVEVVSEAKPAEAVAETPKPVVDKPAEEKPKPAEKEVAITKEEDKPKKTETKTATEPAAKPKEAAKETKPVAVNEKPSAKDAKKAEKTTAKGTDSKAVLVKGSQYETYDLFEIELKKPAKKGFGVQVAVLSTQDALFKKIADLQEDWFSSILVSVQKGAKGEPVYKVILGSFETEKEASSYKSSLKKNKKMDGFVVDLSSLEVNK